MEPQPGHGDQVLLGPRLRGPLHLGVSQVFGTDHHGRRVFMPRGSHPSSAHDNTKFVSSGGDRSVFLWDVTTGNTIRRISAHLAKINVVEFNNDASVVASGKGSLRCSCRWSHLCYRNRTGSYDSTVKLWDLRCVQSYLLVFHIRIRSTALGLRIANRYRR